jgi:hypothetical protein
MRMNDKKVTDNDYVNDYDEDFEEEFAYGMAA